MRGTYRLGISGGEMEKITRSEKIVGWAIIAFVFFIFIQMCLIAAVHAQVPEPETENPYDTNMSAYQAIGKISFDPSFMEGILLSCSGILSAIFTYRWIRRILNAASEDN
jgi:hypothetical protein